MARNDDLKIVADYVKVAGKGELDLVEERIDYRLEAVFVTPPEGRFIKEMERIPIPIKITGTFKNPKREIEAARLLSTITKRKLEDKAAEDTGDILQELADRTGIQGLRENIRRRLFGRDAEP